MIRGRLADERSSALDEYRAYRRRDWEAAAGQFFTTIGGAAYPSRAPIRGRMKLHSSGLAEVLPMPVRRIKRDRSA